MSTPTNLEKREIEKAAIAIGAAPKQLYDLIKFETAGTFSPTIKNPNSSARGLIQFTDKTARDLGFKSSLDLVETLPTITKQLSGAVIPYLKKYGPFPTKQSLFMSVFYPPARNWPKIKVFPLWVRAVNPGIDTVGSYMSKAGGNYTKVLPFAAAGIIITLFLLSKAR